MRICFRDILHHFCHKPLKRYLSIEVHFIHLPFACSFWLHYTFSKHFMQEAFLGKYAPFSCLQLPFSSFYCYYLRYSKFLLRKGYIMIDISKKLKELRKAHNMTQEQVANLIHVSRPTYTQYEIGGKRPGLETLVEIANLYKVSLDYLVGRY